MRLKQALQWWQAMTEIAHRAGAVRSPELRGPSGRLEALYTPGAADAAYAAVVCHPHPLYGGTMHNKVVYHAAKVLERSGFPLLRFNFRGAGASEGLHDAGRGERGDLLAALHWLRAETALPMIVAGFSFGAYVALRTCCGGRGEREGPGGSGALDGQGGLDDPGDLDGLYVQGLIALGLPIQAGDRGYGYDFLAGCALPKLFVSGDRDAFGPVSAVEAVVRQAAPPAELVWVPGADHFFQPGGLPRMQAAIDTWLTRFLGEAKPAGLAE
jgi:alpha/beta superfamily hydrolase